jgi:ParB/RepB/Spo0J family partition protein
MNVSTESRIRDIAIEDIDRSRNHRISFPADAERLDALKQSIEACGQLQPVRVYERGEDQKDKKHPQKYILGCGARRCAAMELLGRKTIRAIVYPPASDAEVAQARAVENLHRQDITPLEEVQAVSDVLEAIKADATFIGDPHEEAATRLGCTILWVRDRDYLHRLTKPVQRFALRSGLPAGHLRELAKLGDPVEQMRLACETAGAPSLAFPAGPRDTKEADWQRKLQDDYFAALHDGKAQRWPVTRLRVEVARVRLSLRVIPWEFDQPVQFGATKLRKCAGCPHNSETDRTLFGIDEDSANPNGFCLNPSCYNAKLDAAEAAKQQAFKKISQREVQTPDAIRNVTPEWMKEASVIGYVKRQLEKPRNGENGTPQSHRRSPTDGRPLTEHEKALKKFSEDFGVWEEKSYKAILKAVNSDPVRRINWCVLLGVACFWNQPGMTLPHVSVYTNEACAKEPQLPVLPAAVEASITLAFKGSRSAWIELLKDQEQQDPDQRGGFSIPHPGILELLADAMDIQLQTRPEWKPIAELAPKESAASKELACTA